MAAAHKLSLLETICFSSSYGCLQWHVNSCLCCFLPFSFCFLFLFTHRQTLPSLKKMGELQEGGFGRPPLARARFPLRHLGLSPLLKAGAGNHILPPAHFAHAPCMRPLVMCGTSRQVGQLLVGDIEKYLSSSLSLSIPHDSCSLSLPHFSYLGKRRTSQPKSLAFALWKKEKEEEEGTRI